MSDEPTLPSLKSSLITGGLGFGAVSLCVFATVAFAERWMYTHLTLLGATSFGRLSSFCWVAQC
jgi:hypothetical protein